MSLTVYLAGPGVFYPDAQSLAQTQKAVCCLYGFTPLHPADLPAESPSATMIYRSNVDMIRRADALLADLDPFRGPEADPGTAFEIGFAVALGKPVVGYLSSSATAKERVARWYGPVARCPRVVDQVVWRDRDENLIEDFGHPVNLMLAEACATIVVGGLEPALCWLQNHAASLAGQTISDRSQPAEIASS